MSENNERDIEIVQRECENCGGRAPHRNFGMLPRQVVEDAPEHTGWKRAFGCRHCGSFTLESPSDEELETALDRIIDFYDENGIVEPEEADEMRR